MNSRITTFAASCLIVTCAFGQSSDSHLLDIKFGGSTDYVASKSQRYLNISFLGKPFISQGEAPKFSNFASGGLADVTTRPLFLNIKQGVASVGGSVLSGYNTTQLASLFNSAIGKSLADFNLVIGVDTQLEKSQNTAYTYGLEYKPIPILSFLQDRGASIFSSYAIFGVSGSSQVDTTGTRTDSSQATFRGLVGKAIYLNRHGVDAAKNLEFETGRDKFGADYRSVSAMEKLMAAYNRTNRTFRGYPEEQTGFLLLLRNKFTAFKATHATPTDKDWLDVFSTPYNGPSHPDLVLWADANGRYALDTNPTGPRWRTIYSANLKYYLDPNKGGTYLQAQYINGFTEVNPGARNNTFVFLVGIQF